MVVLAARGKKWFICWLMVQWTKKHRANCNEVTGGGGDVIRDEVSFYKAPVLSVCGLYTFAEKRNKKIHELLEVINWFMAIGLSKLPDDQICR